MVPVVGNHFFVYENFIYEKQYKIFISEISFHEISERMIIFYKNNHPKFKNPCIFKLGISRFILQINLEITRLKFIQILT